MSFSFSFSGDDIEEDAASYLTQPPTSSSHTGSFSKRPTNTAFPLPNTPLLPAQSHTLHSLLSTLPSKIGYSTLEIALDDSKEVTGVSGANTIRIPRRELWDVRVQLMAEDDDDGLGNLGKDDVKTGVYEGGFKSWECSVDLVRVLAGLWRGKNAEQRILELGCGTALPSLAVFQWHLENSALAQNSEPARLHLSLADYNPTVLSLVTVPNILLSWAQHKSQSSTSNISWEDDGELEITPELVQSFEDDLLQSNTELCFFSGAWGDDFVQLYQESSLSLKNLSIQEQDQKFKNANEYTGRGDLLVLAAETIYSPFALHSFAETLMTILKNEANTAAGSPPEITSSVALVGAKKVYFGVGGSIEDFCEAVGERGAVVKQIREEEDGVRRVVVEVKFAG